MGDTATPTDCPSLEQLMGITDINDPCQASVLPAVSNPGYCYGPTGTLVACPASGQTTNLLPSALGPYTAPSTSPLSGISTALSSIGTWIQANPALAAGIAVGVFFVLSAGKRR